MQEHVGCEKMAQRLEEDLNVAQHVGLHLLHLN